jgi:hypothetical protein
MAGVQAAVAVRGLTVVLAARLALVLMADHLRVVRALVRLEELVEVRHSNLISAAPGVGVVQRALRGELNPPVPAALAAQRATTSLAIHSSLGL